MKANRYTWITALALLLSPVALQAQSADGWSLDLYGGTIMYAEASAIETMPAIGVEALYYLTPRLAVGPTLEMGYGQTDGRYYTAALQFTPDSIRFFQVGQKLTTMHFGGTVLFEVLPESSFSPYVVAGGGGYSLYLDAEANKEATRVIGPMAHVGGGLQIAVTERAGFHLDARDIIYFDYNREALNPMPVAWRNRQPDGSYRFPSAEPPGLAAPESMVHNLRFSVGFRYIPQN